MKIDLDSKLIEEIYRLGRMDETISEFMEKMVEHISSCQEWWEKRDEE